MNMKNTSCEFNLLVFCILSTLPKSFVSFYELDVSSAFIKLSHHTRHVGLSSSSEQEDKPKLQLHAAVTEPVVQASDLLNAS